MNELQLITTDKLAILDTYAENILKSGIMPSGLNTREKIKVVLLTGYELGMSPMRSLSKLFPVNGRCAQMAENMTALARERIPGFQLETIHSDEKSCKLRGSRDGGKTWLDAGWTIEDAKRAGLLGKENWSKYPADMLYARATARLARRLWSDVLAGVSYIPEELDPNIQLGPDGQAIGSYSPAGGVENERTAAITENLNSLNDVTATMPGEKVETLPPNAESTRDWANKKAAEANAKTAQQREKAAIAEKPAKKESKPPKSEKKEEKKIAAATAPAPEPEPTGQETTVEIDNESEPFPAPEDMDQTIVNASEGDDYGSFKIPSGASAGKSLKELGREKVTDMYKKTLAAVSKMKKEDIKQHTIDFLTAAEMWVESLPPIVPGDKA